jgi:pimeloyl-ACP methyl ester carboxylesterase
MNTSSHFRLIIVLLATVAAATVNAQSAPERAPIAATRPAAIDEGAFVTINGVEQWIVVRGDDVANPVLLWVHGGPGGAGGSFATPLFRDWERYYAVVQWDQPGSGATLAKSGEAGLENLTIDRFARDGIAVAEYLQRRLNVDKVLLVGISWGSIIGVEMAQRRPDLFSAYVGTAQYASGPEGRKLGYELAIAASRERGDAAAVADLERVGPPPYERVEDFVVRQRYTLGFPKSPPEAAAQAAFIKSVSAPPAPDARYVARGLPASGDGAKLFLAVVASTLHETQVWDARRLGLVFELPVFVFHGENDINTPASLAMTYCAEIEAPAKACELIPDAGHNTLAFGDELLRLINGHVRPLVAAFEK